MKGTVNLSERGQSISVTSKSLVLRVLLLRDVQVWLGVVTQGFVKKSGMKTFARCLSLHIMRT